MFETFRHDVRLAARSLRRTPGFTAAALLTLALGIGANAAIFSVVDAVLLHPLPFAEPDRLVALYGTSPQTNSNSISYPNFLDWQRDAKTFEALAIWRPEPFFVLRDRSQTEPLSGQMVSADFFSILRVKPVLGRTFTPEEDRLGSQPVALLGEGAWRRRFAANARIIGEPLNLNGREHTIIGVVPDSVRLLSANISVLNSSLNDVFVPIGQYDDEVFRGRNSQNGTFVLGRLTRGVTVSESSAEMTSLARNLERAYPDANRNIGVRVVRLEDDVAGHLQPAVLALFGAVGFVLLIACANVANLLLARSVARSGEFALRLALGASRGRLMIQLMTEGLLLSAFGGLIGLFIAAWGTRVGLQLLPSALPPITQVDINATVVGFSAAVSVVAAILVALTPALRITRQSVYEHLKSSAETRVARRSAAQRVFIVAEIALTLVLLVGAGLMVQSLIRLWAVDPGFSAENVQVFVTSLSAERSSSPDRVRAAYSAINERFSALPGVQSASVEVFALPFAGNTTIGFRREDEPRPSDNRPGPVGLFSAIGPAYFQTMGIPVARGRVFTRQDDDRHPAVVVIDEEFARSIYPGEDPIGKRIRLFNRSTEIVGVVGHVKHGQLDDATATVRSQFYIPYMQMPDLLAPLTASMVVTVARTSAATGSLLNLAKEEIRAIDGGAVVRNDGTMADLIAASLASRRFSLALMGAFACLALLLSTIGIYGVVSYLVGQRTREIGMRMALGAQRHQILWFVLSEGQRLAVAGVVIGLIASFFLTRLIASSLYGISATDPITLALVAALLVLVTLAACYVPARRATFVNPIEALRAEG
jgi:predicted permease